MHAATYAQGDKGAAAIERLRGLQASHHQDKGTVAPPEEVQALSDLGGYLDKPPADDSPALPRGCYRFIGAFMPHTPCVLTH